MTNQKSYERLVKEKPIDKFNLFGIIVLSIVLGGAPVAEAIINIITTLYN